MAFWTILVLGIVQGISEFLPISSSGHLVLFSSIFGIQDSLLLSIILHVASLLAVFITFRKDIFQMLRHPLSNEVVLLAVSTICTCILALILLPIVKTSFSGSVLPLTFTLSGIILYVAEKQTKGRQGKRLSLKNAVVIGLMQGVALFPGLSRSGTTISAGILSGADKKECAKFSFLLSIPTIIGSLLFELIDICSGKVVVDFNVGGLIFGSLLSFSIALVSIKFMIKLTEKTNFKWFSLYLFILSVISLIIFW